MVDRIPKGELCINWDVIYSTAVSKKAGFDEKFAFIQTMGLDLVSLSPHYTDSLKRLPTSSECIWPDLSKWVKQTSLFTFAVLDGAFEWGLRIFGLQDYFLMLKTAPDSLRGFIRSVERLNLVMAERLEAEGINGFILADDIAYLNDLFVNPEVLRSSFIPSLARQAESLLSKNLPVFYHSDGNYSPVIEDIVNAGFTGLQCLEKSAGMDIRELQSKFGKKICLWGHLEVEDITKAHDPTFCANLVESIRELASHGNFILGTTSGIFAGTDITMLRTVYNALSS
jgi:uroporphyrinogen decarboxylase